MEEIVTTAVETAAATAEAASKVQFMFEPLNFVKNLSTMGIGMLGIFIVIGVIIVATALINKLAK